MMRIGHSLIVLFFLMSSCGQIQQNQTTNSFNDNDTNYTPLTTIDSWFNNQSSNQPIFQEGKVYKILQDDNDGSRHQKFIVKLSNGKTLLVAHNIDIAQRIPDLQNNDEIVFKGEYEWNKKGGVVHWTHKDPRGKHQNGYLIYRGLTYD